MGDRAIVVFKDGMDYSSGIYLHWNGGNVQEWLTKAAYLFRKGDNSYAAARFCGFCHEQIPGKLSLGILPPPTNEDIKSEFGDMSTGYTHGDNGVFVVDMHTGWVENFALIDHVSPFQISLTD